MLLVVSPAKKLDFTSQYPKHTFGEPRFLAETGQLAAVLKQMSVEQLGDLMSLSEKLSELNFQRFQNYQHPYPVKTARPAVFAFAGDVYQALEVRQLEARQRTWLNEHLQILSGFYGLLCPFDLILPYRLEMGRSLVTTRGKNLYQFWGDKLSLALKKQLSVSKNSVLVNLASNEYFKVLESHLLDAPVYTPRFLDLNKGQYKIISFYAKRARGLMCRFAAQHKIDRPEGLLEFNLAGYRYSASHSTAKQPTFIRDQTP